MAIFETLSILFKADSTQLKKEIDDVKKKTRETTDTFKNTEEQTKKTDNQFAALSKTLATLAAAYFSVGSIVGGFRASLSHTTELGHLSREINVNIETLDAWGKAVKNFGSDANAFQNSIASISEKFNTTPEVIYEYLPTLADEFKKLASVNPYNAQIYGRGLGIDPGTIAFLSQGGKAVREALKAQIELGVTDEKDAKIAQDFNVSLGKLSDAFNKLNNSVATDLLPKLTSFAETLTKIISAFTFWREGQRVPEGEIPWHRREIIKPLDWSKIFNNKNTSEEQKELFNTPAYQGFNQFNQIPTSIPQVSNSQARSLYVGDININGTEKDAREISNLVVSQIDQKSQFLNQLQQSNSYFDNGVVI